MGETHPSIDVFQTSKGKGLGEDHSRIKDREIRRTM